MNWLLRRKWSVEDRRRQSANARRLKPWKHSTGPRSAEGKQRVAMNGWKNQPNANSRRQIRIALADVTGMTAQMVEWRRMITSFNGQGPRP